MTGNAKRISAVLSTRNRGDAAVDAVRSILANSHPDFEAIVLDQSDDDLTLRSLQPWLGDPRLRYLRSATTGRSAGLNAALREAAGALAAMTDDDCTVPPDWLEEIETAFAMDCRIGVVFGNVLPAPHDRNVGTIPAYVRRDPFLARGIGDKHEVEGIGACMAVRLSVWQSLGGFDEMLGSGSRFRAGEDGDLVVRALFAGHWVYETPVIHAIHRGLREWNQLPALIDGYWRGTGAMLAKSVRAGRWRVILLLARLAGRWVCGQSRVGASLGRTERLRKLKSFCAGFLAGLTSRVDRRTGLFVAGSGAIVTPRKYGEI